MLSRDEIIEAARSFVGVPYVAGGQDEAGLNCAGLLIATGRKAGVIAPDVVFPAYANFTQEASLQSLFGEWLDRLDSWIGAQPGDILSLAYEDDPKHCGVVTRVEPEGIYIVHATRNHGVIEHRLYGKHLRAVRDAYRIKGME